MNLREAIGLYVVGYLQCYEVIGTEGEGVERIRRQAFEAGDRLDRAVKVAEAAERLAEAWLALGEDNISSATWDAFASHVAEYKSAREAVRKLEVD